jgi:chromosome segregation ATPase
MFVDIPQNLILLVAGAFLLGWLLSWLSSFLGTRKRAQKRDPKDDRIRSLEAELRIARSDAGKATETIEVLEKDLEEALKGNDKRDKVISHQQERIEKLSRDLKESVLKTRELRNELSERATESIRSEAKLREVETELEVAQASTNLIATGVLDYSVTPDAEDAEESRPNESDVSKAAN